jgi:putative effector of murein hydrolase
VDPRAYWLSAAGINIGIDFAVLILPLPVITQLRLPRKQKICMVLMFLLGFFVCVVSIVRLATVYFLERRGRLVGK